MTLVAAVVVTAEVVVDFYSLLSSADHLPPERKDDEEDQVLPTPLTLHLSPCMDLVIHLAHGTANLLIGQTKLYDKSTQNFIHNFITMSKKVRLISYLSGPVFSLVLE